MSDSPSSADIQVQRISPADSLNLGDTEPDSALFHTASNKNAESSSSSKKSSEVGENAPVRSFEESANGSKPESSSSSIAQSSDCHEDEPVEPKLKYSKLEGSLDVITENDDLSCIDAFGNTIAVGSHWGKLYVLNLDGTERKRYAAHSATINDVCVDEEEEAIATASDDGKVAVISLHLQSFANQIHNIKRPSKTVALDPELTKGSRQFCHAGLQGDVVFHEKGWFVNKDVTIHSGEGPVYCVRWKGPFIAWSDDNGVKIYNMRAMARIAQVDRPDSAPRADLYRANLSWGDDGTSLLIGWAKYIQMARIVERKAENNNDLKQMYANVAFLHEPNDVVSGVAQYRDYVLALMFKETPTVKQSFTESGEKIETESSVQTSPSDTPADGSPNASKRKTGDEKPEQETSAPARRRHFQQSECPDIVLLQMTGKRRELTRDSLKVRNFQKYRANDYRLCRWRSKTMSQATKPLYYILSPKEIMVGRERDLNDHVGWLLERSRSEEALACAIQHQNKGVLDEQYGVPVVGQIFLDELIEEGDFDKAAANSPKVLKADKGLWEKYIARFTEKRRLDALAHHIPANPKNPLLSVDTYQKILMYFLNEDKVIFVRLLKEWQTHLYRVIPTLHAVERLPGLEDDFELLEALGHLYNASASYCKALASYTRLRNSDMVFKLVTKYSGILAELIGSEALLWMEFNEYLVGNKVKTPDWVSLPSLAEERGKATDKEHVLQIRRLTQGAAVQLLITEVDPSSYATTIVKQLNHRPKFLHVYLDALFNRDMHQTSDFHSLQIELYAEFDYPKLGDFLRASTSYRLDKAYQVCLERDLVPELVFVLGRMGDNKGALTVILERMADINYAIEFAKEQDDEELWQDLIDHSVDKPHFMIALLDNVGAHIDPIRLIRKIPEGLEIPRLKESLIKIMQDYNLQTSLRKGCERILAGDSLSVMEQYIKLQRRGISIQTTTGVCNFCGDSLNSPNALIIFQCGHVYHDTCLLFAPAIGPDFGLSTLAPPSRSGRRVLGTINDASNTISNDKYKGMNWREKRSFIHDKERAGQMKLTCPMCRERMGMANTGSSSMTSILE